MKKLSFTEKNDLIVKHKNADFFEKDLELFKKHCSGHPLLNDLARANKFAFARLDGQMLGALLEVLSIEEILENRIKEKQAEPEPRTKDDIRTLLIEQFELDEADLEALSEIIPLWLDKTDEEIISAVKKLLGEKKDNSNENLDPKDGDGNQGKNTEGQIQGEGTNTDTTQTVQRDNVKVFQERINQAKTIEDVEAILKEDKDGGERGTVQKAGQKRIDILKEPSLEEIEVKKKD